MIRKKNRVRLIERMGKAIQTYNPGLRGATFSKDPKGFQKKKKA